LGRFLENPGLRPELQWVNEAGVTLRHPRGELQVVSFHQAMDDAITRISVATPTGNRFQRVNQGRVTARGVELVADAAVGAFMLGGSGALQRSRGEDALRAAAELEYEPTIYGGLWAEAPLPMRTRLGLDLRGTGRQRYIDIDSGAFSSLSRTLQIGLRLSRAFVFGVTGPWQRLDMTLAVENIADQPIFDQAGLPQPGRTFRLQTRLW
jgi:outer membrane receptor protein involved in Fe transport